MRTFFTIALSVFGLASCNPGVQNSSIEKTAFISSPCQVGIYGPAESFVAITRREDVFSYSFSDGRRGKLDNQELIECGEGSLRIERLQLLTKRPLHITNTRFESNGVMLAGQLLEPVDAGPDTTLVVLAHGSEELGWIEAVSYPYQFVGRGVSVFVYDKRGTGNSAGSYSQNFPQLADDLVAASREAKRLARGRFGRFGLFGFSQGGWIAPLGAERSGADFIGIGYGLVVDILEEDASQVELELREAGYGDDVLAKAKDITNVTARLAVSSYSDGLEELDALRASHGGEAWYPIVRGGFTGVLLGMSTDELRDKGIPMFDRLNIDWSIKPMDVLRDVKVPQFWVLAGEDREAPIAKTLERLETLRGEGSDITIFMFPNTDHGMWEFEQKPDRTRNYTRVVDGYYDLLADWAKDSIQLPYGTSTQK
ncbi:MAG: alpha/beta hydrolase family protein [Gammaproteobacteria bacterium]